MARMRAAVATAAVLLSAAAAGGLAAADAAVTRTCGDVRSRNVYDVRATGVSCPSARVVARAASERDCYDGCRTRGYRCHHARDSFESFEVACTSGAKHVRWWYGSGGGG